METFVIQKMVTEALKQVSLQVFERRYGKQKISDEEQRMVKARYDLVL
jgi:ABC-type Fe3+/spermidine/putrescine transport system ATPase subunit